MENLLPILIGIIWVAFTLYNKGKKKKNVKQPVGSEIPESRPLSVFEQILMGGEIKEPKPFERFFESVDIKQSEIEEEKSTPLKKSPRPFLNEELAQFTQEGQAISVFSENKRLKDILFEQDPETADRDFDLRRAVVYSEILNAPYIGYK